MRAALVTKGVVSGQWFRSSHPLARTAGKGNISVLTVQAVETGDAMFNWKAPEQTAGPSAIEDARRPTPVRPKRSLEENTRGKKGNLATFHLSHDSPSQQSRAGETVGQQKECPGWRRRRWWWWCGGANRLL